MIRTGSGRFTDKNRLGISLYPGCTMNRSAESFAADQDKQMASFIDFVMSYYAMNQWLKVIICPAKIIAKVNNKFIRFI